MDVSVDYPRRVAMISLHTSPLATPGVGDAGGLNVYVAEVARRLGERGLHVDVFTRDDGTAPDEVVEVTDNLRVVHVPAGPRAPVAKEELPDLVPEFADRLEAVASAYDLVHSHYWLSGHGRARPAPQPRAAAGAHHAHHGPGQERQPARRPGRREPDLRGLGESQIVAGAEILTANTTDEAADLVRAYGARPEQDRRGAARRRPAHVPPVRPAAVPRAARRRPRRAGRARSSAGSSRSRRPTC